MNFFFFVLQASLVQIQNVPLILWFSFLPGVGISVPAAAPVQPVPQAPTLQAAPQTASMQPQHQQLLMKQQQAVAFISPQSIQQVGIWMQPGGSLCTLNLCLCNTIKINPGWGIHMGSENLLYFPVFFRLRIKTCSILQLLRLAKLPTASNILHPLSSQEGF